MFFIITSSEARGDGINCKRQKISPMCVVDQTDSKCLTVCMYVCMCVCMSRHSSEPTELNITKFSGVIGYDPLSAYKCFLRATPTLGASGGRFRKKNRAHLDGRRQNFDFNHKIENVRHQKLVSTRKQEQRRSRGFSVFFF